MPELSNAWIPWHDLQPRRDETSNHARQKLIQTIATSTDWKDLIAPLEHYWSHYGTGPFSHYHVLRWQGSKQQLEGIAHPDTIQLSELIGQERQHTRVKANIERFIAGLPAHDMLLYGPPGTGKSSTIKAIANTYAEQGLCLLEINKEHVDDLPLIVAELRGRAPHYLLYIDDLSFEENETSYKKLKVLLEGTSETRPKNVIICANSNRMNLIRENFNERGKPTEDINWRDTMDEKQSLAHRFGLRVTFLSPDQKQYLRIVRELAQHRHLHIAEDDLHNRAMQWERQHTGRSGRSARQFVDDLEAELKYIQPTQITEIAL
jgi:predicted AAA+ superfamily ATPase